MTYMKKICLFLLSILLLLLAGSCNREKNEDEPEITFSYRGDSVDLGGCEILPYFLPWYEEETGALIVCVHREDGVFGTLTLKKTDENSAQAWIPADGSFREILLEKGTEPLSGVLFSDGCDLLTRDESEQFRLVRQYGDTHISAPIADIAEDASIVPREIAVCGDGAVWIAFQDRVVIAEKDLSRRTSFSVADVPFSLVPDGERGAWILTGKTLRRYDANGIVTESRKTPDGVTRLWFSENTLYCEAAKGLFAWEGNGWTLRVDYTAADIVPQNSVLLMVRSDGETLFSLSDGEKRSLWNYRMTERVSEKAEVDMVFWLEPRAEIKKIIANFNLMHPDIHVNVIVYPDEFGGDLLRAKDALLVGLMTGTYQADMICTGYSSLIDTITAHRLFEDLTPYLLRGEGDLRMDNLFGSAVRTMTYDGAIWGIPEEIRYKTLIGLDSLMGDYAGRTAWTLAEELDFIISFDRGDAIAMSGLRQDLVPLKLMYYTDLRAFIDVETGTCSFTSPEAIRFLTYMSSLPVTNEELIRRSAVEQQQFEEGTAVYRDGQVALYGLDITGPFDYFSGFGLYQTDGVTMIGYPMKNAEIPYSGIVTVPSSPTMILKCSDHKEECWMFLQYLTDHVGEALYTTSNGDYRASNILKSEYDAYAESHEGYVFSYYADGSVSCGPEDPKPNKPGSRKIFKKEDAEEFRGILDSAGSPWAVGFDDSLDELVREELSAMTAGHNTPEVCAANLQSRVSIWLAEHK